MSNSRDKNNPELVPFRIKIAPKDHKAQYRIITEDAHNREEARSLAEGKYPNYDIIWVE